MSNLKKEFTKTDVQRLRNLVTGKYGDKTSVGVGYTKSHIDYKEGDIWESDGRTWTIKNGLKQNITKLDKAKESNLMPLFCPECTKIMKNRNDKQFYNIHKKCFNCVIEFETKLKFEGKWEEYEKTIHNSEVDNIIIEFKNWAKDELKEDNNSYVTEAGDIENWVGDNKENLEKNIEESLDFLKTLKK